MSAENDDGSKLRETVASIVSSNGLVTGLVRCRGVCQRHGAAQLSDEAPNRQTDKQTSRRTERSPQLSQDNSLDYKYST